jgi:hypothetical protein
MANCFLARHCSSLTLLPSSSCLGTTITSRMKTATTRRSLLTSVLEPPLTSTVPERPCTVILAQDEYFYKSASWDKNFSQKLTEEYGLSYAQWQLSTANTDFDSALQEMARDLSSIPSQVLVARGPWISWMAQFYLESVSLAGLVLVDPLPLDNTEAVRQLEALFQNLETPPASSALFEEFVNHWGDWRLQLEVGSIPMMVISTKPELESAARLTVQRHSDEKDVSGRRRTIPLVKLHGNGGEVEKKILPTIATWIDEQVI